MTTISDTFDHDVPWEAVYGYSQAHRVGDTVYVSGQLSHDDRGLVGEGDVEKQLEVTFAQLDKILEHFGATRRQIIETTVILTDLRENFGPAAAAHSAYFGDHRPTSTTFGVVELALPGQIVEIGAVVLLDLPR
ncbi:RidA family protein [Pseudonocardia nematodicida]|uniref:RidA family protein n=1 Tax=Pseudonocardia nematodicida TaxID=1206997 RepID=A0ABV1KG39_9PSEU